MCINDFIVFECIVLLQLHKRAGNRHESISWKRHCWLFHLIERVFYGYFPVHSACNVFCNKFASTWIYSFVQSRCTTFLLSFSFSADWSADRTFSHCCSFQKLFDLTPSLLALRNFAHPKCLIKRKIGCSLEDKSITLLLS